MKEEYQVIGLDEETIIILYNILIYSISSQINYFFSIWQANYVQLRGKIGGHTMEFQVTNTFHTLTFKTTHLVNIREILA